MERLRNNLKYIRRGQARGGIDSIERTIARLRHRHEFGGHRLQRGAPPAFLRGEDFGISFPKRSQHLDRGIHRGIVQVRLFIPERASLAPRCRRSGPGFRRKKSLGRGFESHRSTNRPLHYASQRMGRPPTIWVWWGDIGSYDMQRLHSLARPWSVVARAVRFRRGRRNRQSGQSLRWATRCHVAPAADARPIQS